MLFVSALGQSVRNRDVSALPAPTGGWNRVVLRVEDLDSCVETLKKAGVRFRNEIESGPGGKQIQIEDPGGNPIELFEPAARRH